MGDFERPAVEEPVLVKLWVATGGRLLKLAVEKSQVWLTSRAGISVYLRSGFRARKNKGAKITRIKARGKGRKRKRGAEKEKGGKTKCSLAPKIY